MKIHKSLAAITMSVGLLQSAHAGPAPTGVVDNVDLSEGQLIYIPVLANDIGEDLRLTEVNAWTVEGGSVEMNGSHTAVYYTPASGFTGEDSFWYVLKDNTGRTNSTQVFLTVTADDDDTTTDPETETGNNYSGWPAANVDNVTTSKNKEISIAVLENDIGDSLSLTGVNDWTVEGGRASIQGDSVLYSPKADYVGEDSFWYNFVDARGRKNSTQVKVTITEEDSGNGGGGDGGVIADTVLIPMHVDFLKNQYFVWGEPGGLQSRKVTKAARAGSSQLTVGSGYNLTDGQLITYRSTDGQYYTVAMNHSQGDKIYLRNALPAPIAPSADVWNFYENGSHPNTMGYRSLVDFALRNKDISALNTGKHVLLGDSWFSTPALQIHLAGKLNNAQIINEGVGGHTAGRLLERFDRDVASKNPDVVWVIAGTNDYYQGVSVADYKSNMEKLLQKISAIGAKAMVFDSSVSSLMAGGNPAMTEISHQYAQALADLINQ